MDNNNPVQNLDVSGMRPGGPPPMSQEQALQALETLRQVKAAQDAQRAAYIPVMKVLNNLLECEHEVKDVDGRECIVIPVKELMIAEWQYMGDFKMNQPTPEPGPEVTPPQPKAPAPKKNVRSNPTNRGNVNER